MTSDRPPPSSGGAAKRTSSARGPSRTPVKKQRRSLPRRLVSWALLGILGLVLLGAALFVVGYVSTDIPDPNKDFTAQTSFVYYAGGKNQIGRFADQNRTSVPLSQVPDHVQQAVIAAEDRSFYTNKGIDPKGILRAAFSNARGNATQGASTITQQYVKIFYLSQERTFTRKIKEAFVSLKLQRQESKDEILQGYLNTIYFGRGAYGIQAASQAYFGHGAKDLTVGEGAVLASVLNSPTALDPATGRDARARLLSRYRYVIGGMVSSGDISAARGDRLERRLPKLPKIASSNQYAGQKGHLLTLVRKQLLDKGFSEQEISGGGLRVTTTFEPQAMRAAAAAVREQAPKGLKGLHVAVASVDPRSGALVGMYAGQDYLKSQINWALAGGSPGSAFKPFALSAGLQDGYSLKSTFDGNSPYVFPDGTTKVVNEGVGDGTDYGSAISLLTATEQSVNTAYVDLTESMEDGPRKILDAAVKMGIPRDTAGLQPVASISLGSATISPVTMANGYGTIADGGKAKKWFVIKKVVDDSGTVRFRAPSRTTRALPADIDSDVSYALQQVVAQGTGRNALSLDRPAAGKTGTATNQQGNVSSSWFVGYTPQLSTAVMYVRGDGNDNLNCVEARTEACTPGYLVPYFGANYPTATWTQTMRDALGDAPTLQFPLPANVPAKLTDHAPAPTYTPRPTPTRAPSSAPPRSSSPPTPSATPTPTPTPTQAPPSTPPPSTPGGIIPTLLPNQNGNGNGNGTGRTAGPSRTGAGR